MNLLFERGNRITKRKSQNTGSIAFWLSGLFIAFSSGSFSHEPNLMERHRSVSIEVDKDAAEKLAEFQQIYNLRLGETFSSAAATELNCEDFDETQRFQRFWCKPASKQNLLIGAIENEIVSVEYWNYYREQDEINQGLTELVTKSVGPPDVYKYYREGWRGNVVEYRMWGPASDPEGAYFSKNIDANPLEIKSTDGLVTYVRYADRSKFEKLKRKSDELGEYYERFASVVGSILGFFPGFLAFFVTRGYWRDKIRTFENFSNKDFILNALPILAVVAVISYVGGQGGQVCEQQGPFGCEIYGEYRDPLTGPAMFEFFLRTIPGALFGYYWAVTGKAKV